MSSTSHQSPSAFTLLEILVVVSIFTIATLIVGNIFSQNYQIYRFGNEQNQAVGNARKGIETMVKEIREARPGDDGSYSLVKVDDQEFIFFSDIDKDNKTERVHYFLEGTNFKKGTIEPSSNPPSYPLTSEVITTLSEYVRNGVSPIFTYYNSNYPADQVNNPLPAPARLIDTKLMRVYLKINIDPAHAPKDFELESEVQIRNLKTNL